jgi:hypothetical protein
MVSPHAGRRLPSWREALRSFAVLLAMTGIAVAQPLLGVFGDSPETFVFAGADRLDVVVFAILVATVPAIALFGVEVVVGLAGPRARRTTHVVLVGLLTAAAVTQAAPALLGLAAGAAVSVAYCRAPSVRPVVSYLALAPVVFIGLFLVTSPASDLVFDRPVTAESPVVSTTPVVVIVLDELPLSTLLGPDGTIDGDLYPHLAEFAASSTWYRNATTAQGLTLQAVPAILSGQDPGFDDPPALYTEYPDNLFTLFGATHELNVSETVTRLCPPSLCEVEPQRDASGPLAGLLDRAWQVWADRLTGTHEVYDLTGQFAETAGTPEASVDEPNVFDGDDRAQATPRRLDDWLARLDDMGRPSLSAIHLLLPHAPWTFLPSGHTYDRPGAEATGFVNGWPESSDWPALLGRQRHVLQTQYVDSLIGASMERLDATGLFDEAVVVVVADHGANLVTPGNLRAASPDNYEQIMWVPLMIKAPGQQTGRVDDADVRVVDVVPTIADLAGIELPFSTDGVPAGPDRSDESHREGDGTPAKPFHQMNKPPLMSVDQQLLEVDPATGLDQVQTTRFRPDRVGSPDLWPYRIGPHSSLVATSTSRLTRGADDPRSATADDDVMARLGDVDLSRSSLPVFVSGTIAAPIGTRVLLSINDQVAAVSEVFDDVTAGQRFAALVPEALLDQGDNDPQLFTVTDGEGEPVLHHLDVRDAG